MKKEDLTGKKFGLLTVLEEDVEFNKNHKFHKLVCKCECGTIKSIAKSHIKNKQTKSCGCLNKRINIDHPLYNGVGDISGGYWADRVLRRTKKSATHRAIEVKITPEEAWNLFLKQNRKCALSGLDLKFPEYSKDKNWSASLDRIDSSGIYELSNVQWVHKDINVMKNKFKQDYFIKICKMITENYDELIPGSDGDEV